MGFAYPVAAIIAEVLSTLNSIGLIVMNFGKMNTVHG